MHKQIVIDLFIFVWRCKQVVNSKETTSWKSVSPYQKHQFRTWRFTFSRHFTKYIRSGPGCTNYYTHYTCFTNMRYKRCTMKMLYLPTTEAPLSAKASAYSLPRPAERKYERWVDECNANSRLCILLKHKNNPINHQGRVPFHTHAVPGEQAVRLTLHALCSLCSQMKKVDWTVASQINAVHNSDINKSAQAVLITRLTYLLNLRNWQVSIQS